VHHSDARIKITVGTEVAANRAGLPQN